VTLGTQPEAYNEEGDASVEAMGRSCEEVSLTEVQGTEAGRRSTEDMAEANLPVG
jgi:hypothetical protein